jgi:hypothetical protein
MISREEFGRLQEGDHVRLNRPRRAVFVLLRWVHAGPSNFAHWELSAVAGNDYLDSAVLLEQNRKRYTVVK